MNITLSSLDIPPAHEQCLYGYIRLPQSETKICGDIPPLLNNVITTEYLPKVEFTSKLTIPYLNTFRIQYQLSKTLQNQMIIRNIPKCYNSSSWIAATKYPHAFSEKKTHIIMLIQSDVMHVMDITVQSNSGGQNNKVRVTLYDGLFVVNGNEFPTVTKGNVVKTTKYSSSFNVLVVTETLGDPRFSAFKVLYQTHKANISVDTSIIQLVTEHSKYIVNGDNCTEHLSTFIIMCWTKLVVDNRKFINITFSRLLNTGYKATDCQSSGFAVFDLERQDKLYENVDSADKMYPILKLCNTGNRESNTLFISSYVSSSSVVYLILFI